ncbi:MAG TPA: tryptophan synthase subunit alpha [Deltaproteobacteria bacterium]|nr:MAG: tryptophan synthase subunit alpha [Deltaproteobacteria bacterium GWA2_55_82]OGQ62773.1 MAG: tryptophan synthase subunit alpha [Deltaproteobacteria bacterium RIFCSPLOWO2_02_FULL_55_12]OIJ73491.1 MAG: tryptophan synthase subunit alpha [Deltaproteobacteria bacterium GWC2_55_46]HBG46219.1 tryptophan synthase subunit alpha [Deltaproteobacteria bacterium]HCY10126.1 tryptophan synthase subunit alpha [Deltaproteobacteria bacterium]
MTSNKEKRIESLFARLKAEKKKALITFITAGDPDLPTSGKIIRELEKSGADLIELGIPFSDPMADGPTIQASSERALKKNVHLPDVLTLVRNIRQRSEVPIVLFGYYNPVFTYGLKKFARDVKAAGADGVLIVDLPAEEADELKSELDRNSIDLIFLLTPTSDEKRIKLAAQKASGFIYFVSVTGVTGARKSVSADIPRYVKRVKKFTDLPIGVGFGISTATQAKEVVKSADAAVVGSAIVNIIARNAGSKILSETGSFVSSLKRGIGR